MSGYYDIRIHIGEKTRVHHTQGGYRLPPGLEPGDEVVLEAFQPGYWSVRNREGKRFLISMTCVGDAGMLDKPKRPLHPGCKPRSRVPHQTGTLNETATRLGWSPSARSSILGARMDAGGNNQESLFEVEKPVTPPKFDRAGLANTLKQLAAQNVFLGTSSWKYPGWCDQIYDRAKYEYRGKFAETRFDRDCLREYAEVFKTVCVDAAFYRFPDRRYLDSLVSQVPGDFRFSFKVTDEITVRKFPSLPRHGERAGTANANFLNADLFTSAFLGACEEFKKNVGLLMFEFARFHSSDFARGRDFVEALDQFFGKLPPGWNYGVEMRNRKFLQPEYFAVLRKHGVTHVYNSWTEMPSVVEQMSLPDSRTSDDLAGARFLLKPGRKYEDAVKAFSPYTGIKETNDEARAAGSSLIEQSLKHNPRRGTYIYVNNRLEGNAIETLLAMIDLAVRVRSNNLT